MALLYGLVSENSSSTQKDNLKKLSENLKCAGLIDHKFQFGAFSGGLILNPVFKIRLSDLYYLNEIDQVVVIMSGFFYNREELVKLINIKSFSIPQPELAYQLYKKLGKEFVHEINGDFTIAIFHKKPASFLLYRDHVGIRPLSYVLRDDAFWFASDGLGLCKALHGRERINPDFIYRFLKNADEVDVNLLPLQGTKKLLPGHYLEVSSNKTVQLHKYWHPERINEEPSLEFHKVKEDLARLVENAVFIRADQQFTAGTHLSGGLDSGIVAALAKQQYLQQKEFLGFTWSSRDAEVSLEVFDERKLLEDISQQCNINPAYLEFDEDEITELFNDWRCMIEFFHEAILRKHARLKNVNLLFSGWGGDEFISINSRGIDSDLFFKLKWKAFYRKNPTRNPVKMIKRIIINILLPALGINHEWFKSKSEFTSYIKNKKQITGSKNSSLCKWKSRRDVHLALLNFGHLGERAEFWFVNGYKSGLEYRYPLLDKRIIEYMLKVPSVLLFNKGYVRLMLREISRNILPDSVVWSKNKNNPALYAKMLPFNRKVFLDVKADMQEIKDNPDLNFVNYEKLENDILNNSDKEIEEIPDYMSFVLVLKRLHEFTKGYYGK